MQGAIFSDIDVRDYKGVCCTSSRDFPKEFQLPIIRIKNQGSCGSCVAHAISSVNEYYNHIQHNDDTEMSTGYIYGNRTTSTHTGAGMVVRHALEAVRKYGNVTKQEFPENVEVPKAIDLFEERVETLYGHAYPNRISSYCRLTTETDIKAAILDGCPIVIAMDWYKDMAVVNGILTTKKNGNDGGHCMLLVGWNEKGWIIQNSWGKSWGTKGTVIVPYSMDIREKWAVTDNVFEHIKIEKPFKSNYLKLFVKFINWILNLIREQIF